MASVTKGNQAGEEIVTLEGGMKVKGGGIEIFSLICSITGHS